MTSTPNNGGRPRKGRPAGKKGKPVNATATRGPKSMNFHPFDERLFPALDELKGRRGTPFYMRSRTEIMNILLEEGLVRHGASWPPPAAG